MCYRKQLTTELVTKERKKRCRGKGEKNEVAQKNGNWKKFVIKLKMFHSSANVIEKKRRREKEEINE